MAAMDDEARQQLAAVDMTATIGGSVIRQPMTVAERRAQRTMPCPSFPSRSKYCPFATDFSLRDNHLPKRRLSIPPLALPTCIKDSFKSG